MALRSGDTDDGELVGRKIGDSVWAVYASKNYIERHGRPQRIEELVQHALVGFDDTMAKHRIAAWLRKIAPDAVLVARSNSVLGLLYSAKAGVGVAPLPIALGDAEPELVQVIAPVTELTRIWRMLTTAELRHTQARRGLLRLHGERDRHASPNHHGLMPGRSTSGRYLDKRNEKLVRSRPTRHLLGLDAGLLDDGGPAGGVLAHQRAHRVG